MLFKFDSLFKLDIGVDFGSSKTQAVGTDLGIFFDKPTLISVQVKDKSVISVGDGAQEMLGRVPKGVSVVRPIQNSEIFFNTYFELFVKDLMAEFEMIPKPFKLKARPNLYIPVNFDHTRAQLSNFEDSLKRVGVDKVFFLKKSNVSYYGLPESNQVLGTKMIVDIGFSKTDIGVVYKDNLFDGRTLNFGSQNLNDLIFNRLLEDKKVQVSNENIEKYKLNYLILAPFEKEAEKFEIVGKHIKTGLPTKIDLTYYEFREMAIPYIKNNFVLPLKSFINTFSENILNDIYYNGIYLIGGGAKTYSLKKFLQKELNLEFKVLKDPDFVLIEGLKKVLHNQDKISKMLV
jgi:rod shape-determining protein MreB